jgi:ethanolamine utilization protein EutQ (cupin superfamily)
MTDKNYMTIHDAIISFIERARTRQKNLRRAVLENVFLEQLNNDETIKICGLTNVRNKARLKSAIEGTISSFNHDKMSAYKVFKVFFTFLNTSYGLNLSLDDYIKKPEVDKRECRLPYLKSCMEG